MPKPPLVCLQCNAPFSGKVRRTFLGFPKFQCAACGIANLYPLPSHTRTSYQAIGLLFLLSTVVLLLTAKLPLPGLIAVAAAVALWKDRKLRRVTQTVPENGSGSWLHGAAAHLKVRMSIALAGLAFLSIGGWEWHQHESPERIARMFAEARIHVDTTRMYGMLSGTDTHAVSQADFGKGFNPAYLPSYDPWQPLFNQPTTDRVIFDSTRVVLRIDTAAVVEVFLRGPDFERARARMPSSRYSPDASPASRRAGVAAFKDRYLTELAGLPLRSFRDTVRLIHERGAWRVRLALGEREQRTKLRGEFMYGELLSQRATAATKFLTLATSVPEVVADSDLVEARNVVQRKSVADSLRFRMVAHTTKFSELTDVAGVVYNLSHVGVEKLSLRIADASGNTVELTPDDAINPPYLWRGSVSAQDNMPFRTVGIGKFSGPIVRVEVLDLKTW